MQDLRELSISGLAALACFRRCCHPVSGARPASRGGFDSEVDTFPRVGPSPLTSRVARPWRLFCASKSFSTCDWLTPQAPWISTAQPHLCYVYQNTSKTYKNIPDLWSHRRRSRPESVIRDDDNVTWEVKSAIDMRVCFERGDSLRICIDDERNANALYVVTFVCSVTCVLLMSFSHHLYSTESQRFCYHCSCNLNGVVCNNNNASKISVSLAKRLLFHLT